MTELEKINYRVCFTGHRPEKLTRNKIDIQNDLEIQIKQANKKGRYVYISGMARGVDIWAAQIVLKLKDSGYPLKLICACPYDVFEKNWSYSWQMQYRDILKSADLVKYICKDYSRYCFQIRNKWMVDHSSMVISVFNGKKSGTKNTIDYAEKLNIPIIFING